MLFTSWRDEETDLIGSCTGLKIWGQSMSNARHMYASYGIFYAVQI